MKKNIIYMVGALLSAAILTLSCAEDSIPSYSELDVDKANVFMKIDNPTAEINITEGNGNYKVAVADENIATAKIDGSKVIFTGLKNGETTATITDWAKHSKVIAVRVKEDFEFKIEKNELSLIKDVNPFELVTIISGNDHYKIESSNDEIATAELTTNGQQIKVTAQSTGKAKITIIDGDGLPQYIDVTAAEHLLELGTIPEGSIEIGETRTIEIKSGNGEYKFESTAPEVAKAEIVDNTIVITSLTVGEATITVTDKAGFTATIDVKTSAKLVVDITSIDELVIDGEEKIVTITSGSGDYSFKADGGVTCTVNDNIMTLKAKGKSYNQKVTLTDNKSGKSVIITVVMVDYSFLDKKEKRYFIKGSFVSKELTSVNKDGARERMTISSKAFTGGAISGFRITFMGGLTPGLKTEPILKEIDGIGREKDAPKISNLRIEQAADGWYWVKFREEGMTVDSYMVVQ